MHEKEKKKKISKKDLKIVEGAASVWHYHLSESGDNGRPTLCGRIMVMHTEIPLSSWKSPPGHIPSSYCKECDAIYEALE